MPGSGPTGRLPIHPVIVPRAEHSISRAQISENALKVLYRLKNAGYEAYLVGGGVRDLLLGREPKDFDVATDASPEQVEKEFRNCRLIGRRFRLAHVRFGDEIIEVATFRSSGAADTREVDDEDGDRAHDGGTGRILRDNIYGTVEEDAERRDFSVNALYYDIRDFSVRDYVGGLPDLRDGVLRLIGDPEVRYREDPVRMLRAVRFAVKLGFKLHPDTEAPIARLSGLLADVPPARMFEEILKLFLYGFGEQAFEALRHHGLFEQLFPRTEAALAVEEQGFPITFIGKALASTDGRVQQDLPVTPAFLFAALLWEPVRRIARRLEEEGLHPSEALRRASAEVVDEQVKRVALPRRFSTPMIEIFSLQPRFLQRQGKRPQRLMEHPRFRAAYDFMVLRAQAGETDPEIAEWWTQLLAGNPVAPPASTPGSGTGRRRRRRRGGRGRRRGGDGNGDGAGQGSS
ncbi:MAG TPA: polynucleotide adenylyltransferase PcnB [Gammaproteobacteria bacterium]|nr:polynucleotide adenylyltransferase PcnB [Gammaproteobacteria bacterium]